MGDRGAVRIAGVHLYTHAGATSLPETVRAALDEIPQGVMRRLAYQQFKRSYPEITDYGPDGSA